MNWKHKTVIGLAGLVSLAASPAIKANEAEEVATGERPALPFPRGVSVHSQCGAINDLQDVESYDGSLGVDKKYVDNNEAPTLQLQWLTSSQMRKAQPSMYPGTVFNQRWCSGVLFNEKYVLTAGHCFDIQRGETGWVTPHKLNSAGEEEYAAPEILATLQKVNFNYQVNGNTGEVRAGDSFPVKKLVEHRLGAAELDYAILELGPNEKGVMPGSKYPSAKITARSGAQGEILAIIQHPQGQPKKVGAGSLQREQGASVYYDNIDTFGGSSGSPVRDIKGEVIAVHTNGGCQIGSSHGANRGVSVEAISSVSGLL